MTRWFRLAKHRRGSASADCGAFRRESPEGAVTPGRHRATCHPKGSRELGCPKSLAANVKKARSPEGCCHCPARFGTGKTSFRHAREHGEQPVSDEGSREADIALPRPGFCQWVSTPEMGSETRHFTVFSRPSDQGSLKKATVAPRSELSILSISANTIGGDSLGTATVFLPILLDLSDQILGFMARLWADPAQEGKIISHRYPHHLQAEARRARVPEAKAAVAWP